MLAGWRNARVRQVTKSGRPRHDSVRRGGALGCAAAALLALASRAAHAAPAPDYPRDLIEGTSACPEPRAVWGALGALVVIDAVEQRLRAMTGQARAVEVTDLGAAFRVRAGDRAREYEDPERDCGNRAKLAALFVALAADSADDPTTAQPPPPPPAPPPPVAAAVVVQPGPAPLRSHVLHLEVGADARVGVGASTVAPGGLAQLAWGRGRLSIAGGVRGSAPAQATIGGVALRQWRLGAQIAARVALVHDRAVMPFLELGAAAGVLSERAVDLATSRAGLSAKLGLVAGGGVSFLRRNWGSPFVLVEAELDPVPPTVSALPVGDLGRTPRVWLGAAAGVSVGLF